MAEFEYVKHQKHDKQIVETIRMYMFKYDCATMAAAAKRCGMSESTLNRRMKKPVDFSVSELRKIKRGLKIPDEDLRDFIL